MKRPGDDHLLGLIRKGSKPLQPRRTGVSESGRLPRLPRAVLFDVYGTLLVRVDDPVPVGKKGGIDEAAVMDRIARRHAAMRDRGVRHPEVRIERIWQALLPGRGRDELREMIVAHELAAHPCWPMPGARGVISFLARRGITIGIVSNAQFYTPIFLHALLGADLEAIGFTPELCVYSFDLGAAKPDPSLFERAGEILGKRGVMPEETLMVGNSPKEDILPARQCGFMTALAALDRRSFPAGADRAGGADAVITALGSLRRLVGKHVQPPGL